LKRYTGKSVLNGIAIGKVAYFNTPRYKIDQRQIEDTAAEILRFEAAVESAKEQLASLYENVAQNAGKNQAMIFGVHKMMLEDEEYLHVVRDGIRQGQNAEYAVRRAGEHFAALFAVMDDEYMKARAADVTDISNRVIHILLGIAEAYLESNEPVIVVAQDLTPGETVNLDRDKLLGFVTVKGSTNSHTAILARSLNIPVLVGLNTELGEEVHGKTAIIDGFHGEFIVEPTQEVLEEMRRLQREWTSGRAALAQLIGKKNITSDGRSIDIYANISSTGEAEAALRADAGGIGLFRSEFLYLGRRDYPAEEEQFHYYKEVIQKMEGRRVTIRTLDIGADKKADYFNLEPEANPALGYRAIRICLDRPAVLITQLRAIYRAAAYGNAAVMFPMIVSVEEVLRLKEIAGQVKRQLEEEKIPTGNVKLGIMIETPAAAILSDQLAEHVDFFSIGTNDLTQYTLAADRQNPRLSQIANPHHPAVLRLIELTVQNGHKAGIPVGICGELAADRSLTGVFLDMGVDELSVAPSSVLEIRQAVLSY
jgi:phosphotransferase system enzyme I (PtsI)